MSSDPAPEDPPVPPAAEGGTDAPAAESGENSSESEEIRQRLIALVNNGYDLRNTERNAPKGKIAACHIVADDMKVPYGNVTKQVKAALRDAAVAGGKPESVRKSAGSAKVNVKLPPPSTPPAAPSEPAAGSGDKSEPDKPDLRAVYLAAKNETELRETPEYRWLAAQVKMGINIIDEMYKQIGLVDPEKSIMSNAPPGVDMVDLTVQMCMKYNWYVPDRLEKLAFFGSWGALLILPPLAKFGILDDIKSGKLGKKKPDPKQSDKPLTDTGTKV